MDDRLIINKIHGEAFLIKDSSLSDIDAPFLCWLRENGFRHAWYKGHYDCCNWVYVNITHKLFAYGMPGVQITTPVGNHAITMSEFFTIYNIYDNYRDLKPLEMERAKEPAKVRYYVKTNSDDSRSALLDFLDNEGFKCDSKLPNGKKTIMESPYPVTVHVTDQYYSVICTTTSAAAAMSSYTVVSDKEFYVYYKKSNSSYEEFVNAVKAIFARYGYNQEEIDTYFSHYDTLDLLKTNYEGYNTSRMGAFSPSATAHCLYLLY